MPLARAVWMAVGAVAILASLSLAVRDPRRWKTRLGGQALAIILWSTFAVNAWAVKTRHVGCCVTINAYPPLGYVGGFIAFALLADLLLVVLGLLGEESPVEEAPAAGGRGR